MQIIGFGGKFETLFPERSVEYSATSLAVAQNHAKNIKADLGVCVCLFVFCFFVFFVFFFFLLF
jgi:ribose 5-phosphate isomerase RpiB